MNEAEVEIVAEELAKLGGTSWYPGREPGPLLRIVHDRYRDRARAAIAALDRFRAQGSNASAPQPLPSGRSSGSTSATASEMAIEIGTTVIYRPEGDRRAYPCIVKEVSNGFALLVPENRTGIGWVPIADLVSQPALPATSTGNDRIPQRTGE